ncbi:MAG: alanine racemase [Rhizobiaceae bacterium]|nr:alanine racemase [Rhizobiaceae bacterium]
MTDYSILPALVDERLSGGRVRIDLDALKSNWKKLAGMTPTSKTAAVVKADGYGLGVEQVVSALTEAGCETFFVALPEEGVRVKKQAPSAQVFVLEGLFKNAVATYAEADLTPVLGSIENIELWASFWHERGSRRPCAIHVDTGMNRLGLRVEEAKEFVLDDSRRNSVTPILVMSHPACSDELNHPKNAEQVAAFNEVRSLFPGVDASFANSAGIIGHKDFIFDLSRPGIALYGGEAIENFANPMKPVVTLEGRIIQIRRASAGETIGYAATHTFTRETKIALVAVGYADGYLRSNSGFDMRTKGTAPAKGPVGYLCGREVPIIGRVSMDITALDVTDIPEQELEKAEWVELFGNNIALDDAARAAGTIGYELLTGLGARYSRTYISSDKRD